MLNDAKHTETLKVWLTEREIVDLMRIAADMDMSQSELSRKLAGHPEDPRHFTLKDLEKYIEATGDVQPIYWLVERYLASETDKQARAMSRLASVLPELEALLRAAKGNS